MRGKSDVDVNPERFSPAYLLGRALPFLVTALAILADLFSPDRERFDRFLYAVPALAAATWGVRGTLGIGIMSGLVAAGLDALRGEAFVPPILASTVVMATITLASAWASRTRQNREKDLRIVSAVAEVAQNVVLRPLPPRLGQVGLHLLYEASAEKAHIGGDFYKALRVPGGVRLMLGDVQGKGLGAVEAAELVLSSFRESAYTAPDLPDLAKRLETSMVRYGERTVHSDAADRFITVVLAEILDDRPTIRLLSCGHPGPAVQRGSTVRIVEFTHASPPINLSGLVNAEYEVEEFPFDVGDRLLMYTDGVSEARDGNGAFYPLERRLQQWIAEPDEKITGLLREDLTVYSANGLDDDVAAMLVTRLSGPNNT